jgi:hypothetical protein
MMVLLVASAPAEPAQDPAEEERPVMPVTHPDARLEGHARIGAAPA